MVARYALLVALLAAVGCAGVNTTDTDGGDDGGGPSGPGDDGGTSGGDDGGRPPSNDLLQLKGPLDDCGSDAECASGACKPVGPNGTKLCVLPCKAQKDCGVDS